MGLQSYPVDLGAGLRKGNRCERINTPKNVNIVTFFFSERNAIGGDKRDISRFLPRVLLVNETQQCLRALHPQFAFFCEENSALERGRKMMETYGKRNEGEELRGPWGSVGTCLETKCLEPKLPKRTGGGEICPFIPTSTINFRGQESPASV